jgi:hypothetical protein
MLFMVEESVRSATPLKKVLTTNHLPLLTPTA